MKFIVEDAKSLELECLWRCYAEKECQNDKDRVDVVGHEPWITGGAKRESEGPGGRTSGPEGCLQVLVEKPYGSF